ncbi:TlpA disulfide reductase family protein [Massilia sp. TS11]|uniref:TlpA family protein disulfide reductase n=1 Tax=Massilia sp. TS11 TaxID=2908003 RepID=UPI001EDA8E37|nr:TlpA disulfide reductase family protein [Massilia sp. TS11]MCG2583154.1 TlpA family protein disulfide reductase [Massilia sp. TS11]
MPRLLLALLAALAFQSAPAADLDLRSLTKDLGNAPISALLNQKGEPVSEADFLAAVKAGTSFKIEKEMKNGVVTAMKFTLIDRANLPPAGSPVRNVKAGDALPDFALQTAKGERFSKASFAGSVTLLNFSFAACAPCIGEVPHLNAFAAAHPEIKVASITFDKAAESAAFLDKTGLRWPQLVDAMAYLNQLGVRNYPAFLLIGPDGKLLADGTNIATRDGRFLLEEWVNSKLKN